MLSAPRWLPSEGRESLRQHEDTDTTRQMCKKNFQNFQFQQQKFQCLQVNSDPEDLGAKSCNSLSKINEFHLGGGWTMIAYTKHITSQTAHFSNLRLTHMCAHICGTCGICERWKGAGTGAHITAIKEGSLCIVSKKSTTTFRKSNQIPSDTTSQQTWWKKRPWCLFFLFSPSAGPIEHFCWKSYGKWTQNFQSLRQMVHRRFNCLHYRKKLWG